MGDFFPFLGPVDASLAGPSRARTLHGVELEEEEDVLEEDEFQLARSYFDIEKGKGEPGKIPKDICGLLGES